ncbi:MAG: polysaccharide pyruvyl transferase family protein [Bacilli bacterium]|nr:polysaccharide pyruvyl transferase family protein [Bacilli bacterium]
MKLFIYLLKKVKQNICAYYEIYFNKKKIKINKTRNQAYVFFAADYNNLGDIAITLSQIDFLKNHLSKKYEIISINTDDSLKVYLDLKKKIDSSSILTFIGGGNNGDIYEFIDFKRRFYLKKFSINKIILFPQTVVYSDTYNGKKKLNEFVTYSKKCKNISIFAREKKSFDKYKNQNIKNVFLTPDIVFSFNYQIPNVKRKNIGLIMRDDIEKSLSADYQNVLISQLKKYKLNIEYMDTCSEKISINDNIVYLDSYLNKLSHKKIVVTDRLHGMIFCYITNTPCIVFNNNNDKILSTFNTWLKEQNFILLASDRDKEINEKINYLLDLKSIVKKDLNNDYSELLEVIKNYEEN